MLLSGFDENDVTHMHPVFHIVHGEVGSSLKADEHVLAILVDVTALRMAILARIVEMETTTAESRALHDSGKEMVAPSVCKIKEAVCLHRIPPAPYFPGTQGGPHCCIPLRSHSMLEGMRCQVGSGLLPLGWMYAIMIAEGVLVNRHEIRRRQCPIWDLLS
jgi:hypothetical protein